MTRTRDNLEIRAVSTFRSKGHRPAQEDYLLNDREKGIFVIADGFGGPVPGLEAAQTACEAVRSFLFRQAGDLEATLPFELRTYFSLAGNVLFNSLIYANKKLMALNKSKNVHEKGGASVLAGFIDGSLLAIAHVGLCTARLLRENQWVELVKPRSYGQLCDPFALESQDDFRVPLIALGTAEHLEPEIFEYKLREGDWLILSTDGVSMTTHDEVIKIKQKKLSIDDSIGEVMKLLNNSIFVDNASISIIVL